MDYHKKDTVLCRVDGINVLTMVLRLVSISFDESLRWSLSEVVTDIISNRSADRCFLFEVLVAPNVAGKKERNVYFLLHQLYSHQEKPLSIQCDKLQKALLDRGYTSVKLTTAETGSLLGTIQRIHQRSIVSQPKEGWHFSRGCSDSIIGDLVQTLPDGTAFSLLLTRNNSSKPVRVTGMSLGPTITSLSAFKSALPSWKGITLRTCHKGYVEARLLAHVVDDKAIGRRTMEAQTLSELLLMPVGYRSGLSVSSPASRLEDFSSDMLESQDGILISKASVSGQDWNVYLHARQLERGTCILGAAGSGKTALMRNLMAGCQQAGMNVLCLDLEGTELRSVAREINADIYTMGGGASPSPFPINCFQMTGMEKEEVKELLKEVFISTLDCDGPLSTFLADTLEMMYSRNETSFSLNSYKSCITYAFSEKYKYSEEVRQNLQEASKVRLHLIGCLRGGADDTFDVEGLATESHFIEFQRMTSEHEKLFSLTIILFSLLTFAKKRHAQLQDIKPLVIFIDELHIILDSLVNPKVKDYLVCLLKKIIHEGRKYKIWLCVADQSPKLLMPIIEAAQTKIIMRADTSTEELSAQLMNKDVPAFLPRMKTGEAFVRAGSMCRAAFVNTVPPTSSSDFTDEQVTRYMKTRGLLKILPNQRQEEAQIGEDYPSDWSKRSQMSEEERLTNEVVDFAFTYLMEYPDRRESFVDSFNLRTFMKAKGKEELTPTVSERLVSRYAYSSIMHFLSKYK